MPTYLMVILDMLCEQTIRRANTKTNIKSNLKGLPIENDPPPFVISFTNMHVLGLCEEISQSHRSKIVFTLDLPNT